VLLLGIETSCDDTATAVVRDGRDVLSNVSTNQDEFHAKYGGIVPEIASRRHASLLSAAVDDALARADTSLAQIDGIAVTAGPGLIGSLVVGVATAKALAFATGKPLYAVNHLHGHLFAAFLDTDAEPPYPFLALLVSGGHSQLVAVESARELRVIAKTRDDAAGEAFDKTARLLGLPFPGGPALEALARSGNPKAVAFPRYRPEPGALDLSFSGLKTSARYFLASDAARDVSHADIAASFQAAIVDVLIDRVDRALDARPYAAIVLSGGVAANATLAAAFRSAGERRGVPAFVPERRFSTDNAAMIAAAAERRGDVDLRDPLTLSADPNLPFA
jgi:N6-L-threonylcarbamoyladenine synthase